MTKSTKEVLASVDFPVVIAKAEGDVRVRAFTCKDSGQTIVANFMANPFSPITGGKMAPLDKKVLTISAKEMSSFESLGTCPECGAQLMTHKATADALTGNHIHCIVCGEELAVDEIDPKSYWGAIGEKTEEVDQKEEEPLTTQTPVEAEGEEPVEETEEVKEEVEEPVEAEGEEELEEVSIEEEPASEEAPAEEPVEAEGEEEEQPAEEPVEEVKEETEEVEAEAESPEMEPVVKEELPAAPEVDVPAENPVTEDLVTQQEPVEAETEDEPAPEGVEFEHEEEIKEEVPVESEECPECGKDPCECPVEEKETVESEGEEPVEAPVEEEQPAEEPAPAEEAEEVRIDMLARVQAGLNSKKIQIVASGKDTLHYVMVSNKPVATLHRSRACAEVRDIFNNIPFLTKSLAASIEKDGLTKATADAYGLVPMILKVKASEVIEKAVEDQLSTMEETNEQKREEADQAYEQSIGIAAVGINRNVFADTKNVLAEELIDKFEEMGVDDAREVVESCFMNCGEDYIRSILAKANEYKTKPTEVRNEIAATVVGANFKSGLDLEHKVQASVKEKEVTDEQVSFYKSLF